MKVGAKIDELLDRWEESLEAQSPLMPEELCADCPELLETLKLKIQALQQIDEQLKTKTLGGAQDEPDPLLESPPQPRLEIDFKDLRYLNSGALGVVFVGRDERLHRESAIKFIGYRLAHRPDSVNQFLQEAEITSRLDHPGIVPVYGLGRLPNGRLFYAMRYIQGTNLKEAGDEFHSDTTADRTTQTLAFRKLLTHFIVACKTVAYAHRRGIVHRDLKPEHIMLGRYGETLVVDWGLAMQVGRSEPFKDHHEETLLPQLGSNNSSSSTDGAGTLAYMSPEQLAGGISLTPASDIYSLGVVLYRLLCGKLPFNAGSTAEMRQLILSSKLLPPSKHNPNTPSVLDAVSLKVLARDPKDRYLTAMDLATDLERYLADEPVSVISENRSQQLARWARRHRVAAQSIVAAIALVAVIALGATLGLARASHVAQQARDESLQTSATFAARMLAQEIEGRWSVLTAAGSDPELIRIVQTLNAHPDRDDPERLRSFDAANAWLARHRKEYSQAFPSASWALFDLRGMQCGRASNDAIDLLNRSFAYRSYFHGEVLEREPDEAVIVKPLEAPSLSPPYRSTAFPVPTSTLSVPVRVDGEVAAVLTMSVTAGDFQVLRTGQTTHQHAILLDVRPDSTRNKGVVLHHGAIDARGRKVDEPFIYVKRELVEDWSDQMTSPAESPRVYSSGEIVPEVDLGQRRLAVARAPVLVRQGLDEFAPCGWLVLMTQTVE